VKPTTAAQHDQKRRLIECLREFVDGKLNLPELYQRFYYPFVDDLNDDCLAEEDWEFLGSIHEKMDVVAPDPDQSSRNDGWISVEEFRAWVGMRLQEVAGHSDPTG
jgi:hypothetical protein